VCICYFAYGIIKLNMKKFRLSKKLIVSIVIILVATAGVAYYFFTGFGTTNNTQPIDKADTKAKKVEINKKIQQGDKTQANNLAKELVAADDTVDNRKLLVYTEQLKEDYNAVVEAYTPIINDEQLNYQDYQNIADAYYNTDDKPNAAKYYRLAADSWPTSDPARDQERDYLYDLADLLEGKLTDA